MTGPIDIVGCRLSIIWKQEGPNNEPVRQLREAESPTRQA
jgi:hypothetical protein